jgi:hypothetical protein
LAAIAWLRAFAFVASYQSPSGVLRKKKKEKEKEKGAVARRAGYRWWDRCRQRHAMDSWLFLVHYLLQGPVR